MATKKATTTKNTSTKNTKTTTTTTSSRPYSSPNYTTTTTTTTTTPKASTSSTSKNTTPTTTANKTTNTTATKTSNTSTPTVSKSTTTGSTTLPYTTPNASAYEQPKNTAPVANNPVSTVANNVAPYIQTAIAATGTPAATTTPTIANSTPSTSSSASDLLDAIVKSNTIAGTANTEPISNLMGNTPAAAINAERPYSNPNYEYTTEENPSSALDTLEDILSFGVASEKNVNPIGTGKSDTLTMGTALTGDGGGGHHSFGDEGITDEALNKGDLGAYADLLDTLSSEGIPGYEVPYSSPNVDTSGILGGGDVSSKGNDVNVSVGGGSGRVGGGGSSSLPIGNSQADVDALYELLNQRLGEYDNNYESLLASLMDQYNLNYANLDDAYRAALEMLGRNYNSTEALLSGQLANSRNDLEEQRRRALQEAYISRMMNEKNLENILAGYGLSGGATESVLANMRNNYANNRNSVEQNISSLLNELLLNYANNISNARAKYNEGVMNAEQNRLSGRQSLANNLLAAQNEAASLRTQQRAAAEEDLFDALAKLTLNGYSY